MVFRTPAPSVCSLPATANGPTLFSFPCSVFSCLRFAVWCLPARIDGTGCMGWWLLSAGWSGVRMGTGMDLGLYRYYSKTTNNMKRYDIGRDSERRSLGWLNAWGNNERPSNQSNMDSTLSDCDGTDTLDCLSPHGWLGWRNGTEHGERVVWSGLVFAGGSTALNASSLSLSIVSATHAHIPSMDGRMVSRARVRRLSEAFEALWLASECTVLSASKARAWALCTELCTELNQLRCFILSFLLGLFFYHVCEDVNGGGSGVVLMIA